MAVESRRAGESARYSGERVEREGGAGGETGDQQAERSGETRAAPCRCLHSAAVPAH